MNIEILLQNLNLTELVELKNIITGTIYRKERDHLQKREETKDKYIDEVNVGIKTVNALSRQGITTLKELSKNRKIDVIRMRGVGHKGIMQIESAFKKYGFWWKYDTR